MIRTPVCRFCGEKLIGMNRDGLLCDTNGHSHCIGTHQSQPHVAGRDWPACPACGDDLNDDDICESCADWCRYCNEIIVRDVHRASGLPAWVNPQGNALCAQAERRGGGVMHVVATSANPEWQEVDVDGTIEGLRALQRELEGP